MKEYEDARALARDGMKFIHNFCNAPTASTPHLYMSALAFTPQNSVLYRTLKPKFPWIARVAEGHYQDWPAAQILFQGHTDWVTSVAFSPDGTRILSGSDVNTVRVWDGGTEVKIIKDIEANALTSHEGYMSSSINGELTTLFTYIVLLIYFHII